MVFARQKRSHFLSPHNEASQKGTMLQTHCFLGPTGFPLSQGWLHSSWRGALTPSILQGQSGKLAPLDIVCGTQRQVSMSALVLPGDTDPHSTKPCEEEGHLGSKKEAEGLRVPSHPIPRGELNRKKRRDQKLLPVWSQFLLR